MFAQLCLRQLVLQRSSLAHCSRRRAQRTFSSSSACFLRRHQGQFRPAKGDVSEDHLSAELLEPFEQEEEDLLKDLDEELETSKGQEEPSSSEVTFWQWLEKVAPEFRDPRPRNWLGGDVPFPLNSSFQPPIPLSDALRTQLYQSYMTDPQENSVRTLSSRHNIGMKRVDAILRLKGLEEAWKKRKPLQTGFTKGMEWLLAVPEPQPERQANGDIPLQYYHTGRKEAAKSGSLSDINPRYNAEEADWQDEVEGGNDMARFRYQRMFWENVPEGEEPVMPAILEAVQSSSRPVKPNAKVSLVEPRLGRPAIRFVDIGNTFFDAEEQERRDKEGARRSMLKARKRERAQPSRA